MADQPRLIRVFLSSPGDVPEERKIATGVLDALQYDPVLRGQVTVQVVAWDQPGSDTPLLANMNPQEAINQGMPVPADCDVVIVILWSRMGTPLPPEYTKPNGERYLSGTEWEFLNAVTAANESAKQGDGMARPRVVIYRRMDKINLDPDDPNFDAKTEQWRRVKNFFASFVNPDGSLRQGFNTYESPEQFRVKFEEHIKKLISQLITIPGFGRAAAGTPIKLWKGSPFPGLRSFTPDDEPIFYGRGSETDDLVERVRSSRLVAVVGASGSGKSSLVAAGVLPRLSANAIDGSKDWILPSTTGEVDDRVWVGARFTPGENINPFVPLATRLAEPLKRDPAELAAALESEPEKIETVFAPLFEGRPAWAELLIYIDQFEELLTLSDKSKIDAFVKLLKAIHDSQRLRVILTLRADFYARCVEILTLSQMLKDGTFPLSAPSAGALYEMIARPADRAGLSFEEGLVSRILDDTGTDAGSLALLAYLLDELYRKSITGDSHQLTTAQYEALGGVQGAIGKRAEEVIGALPAEEQAALPRLFSEIVEVDARGRGTRRRALLDRLTGDPAIKHIVEVLIAARLLVTYTGEDGRSLVEVAHEALVREWDRLATWITSAQADLLLRSQLEQAARDWSNAATDKESYGLVGDRLLEAQRWQNRMALDPQVADFIQASAGYDAARKAAEDQRKAELIAAERSSQQAARRAIQRTRIAFGVIGVAVIIGIAALYWITSARATTAQAELTVVAAQATGQQANQKADAANTLAAKSSTQVSDSNIQIAEAQNEINSGSTIVANTNETLIPIPLTITAAQVAVGQANQQEAKANALVTNTNNTLTPIALTIVAAQGAAQQSRQQAAQAGTSVANGSTKVADANTLVAQANQQVLNGNTLVANTNNTLTPIPLTIVAAQAAARQAKQQADAANLLVANANATLTPVPITLTAVSRQVQAANQQALAANLAADSVSELSKNNGGNSELAALLAIRSLKIDYLAASDQALQNASNRLYSPGVIPDGFPTVAVAFSPDGKTVLTAGSGGNIMLWDAQSLFPGNTPQLVKQFSGQGGDITSVAFSLDDKYILTGSSDATAVLWEISSGNLLLTLKGVHTDRVSSVAISPDGKQALTGSYDHTAIMWDLNSGKLIRTLKGHTDRVTSVAFSPDGQYAATGSADTVVDLWDLSGKSPNATTLNAHSNVITQVVFSSDSKQIAASSEDTTVSVWNIATPAQTTVTLFGHATAVTSLAFSPDGTHMLTGSQDQTARIWDLTSGRSLLTLSGHTSDIRAVAWSPDGGSVLTGSLDNTARLWNLNEKDPTVFYLPPYANSTIPAPAQAVAFSPDSKLLLVGSSDGAVRQWNLQNGQIFPLPTLHTDQVTSVAFSPDGLTAVSGSTDKTAIWWDLTTGKEIKKFTGHKGNINGVAFSPDGKTFLSGSDDGTAIQWDLTTGRQIKTLAATGEAITSVAFSPDGQFALTGGTGGLARRWDLATGQIVQTFKGHQGSVTSVAFSPDGRDVLTGSTDRTALLWVVADGQQTSQPLGAPFVGHGGIVYSVAFSSDGNQIVTGSADHTVRLWDVATRATLRVFNVSTTGWVKGVAFSADGTLIASASDDGVARLFKVDYQNTIDDVCNRLVRDFTDGERKAYGIIDQHPTCPQFAALSVTPTDAVSPTLTPTLTLTPGGS